MIYTTDTGISTTSTSLVNAVTSTITPVANTDLFLHAKYQITANALTNSPYYDLYVDNAVFDGNDQRRYISSSTDKGSGTSVGLAQGLLADTEYNISLRHASASSNTLTSNYIELVGFGLTINSITLPVELSDFYILPDGSAAKLYWNTAAEINNERFVIERSVDFKKWESVGEVPGFGNSNQNNIYSFVDSEPVEGISYYRLRQIDYDGKNSLIGTHAFFYDMNELQGFYVYPTVCNDLVAVRKGDQCGEEIKVFTGAGIDVTGLAVMNFTSGDDIELDLSAFAAGQYIISCGNACKKIIKL